MAKRPPNDELIFADFDAEWLNTPSPFDELDDDWISIIKFFVFHIPVKGVSARGRTLSNYHWGEKSKQNDFKVLKARLIAFGNMNEDAFKCVDNWNEMQNALSGNSLIAFPSDITNARVTYRNDKGGVCESLCNHIRNAFAHGRLAFYQQDEETYIALEDIDDKKTVTARMMLSKTILLRWIKIIEAGPFSTEDDLKQALALGE